MLVFAVIAALFVATVLLWLSMRRHLARIDVDGPSDVADAPIDEAGGGPSGKPEDRP